VIGPKSVLRSGDSIADQQVQLRPQTVENACAMSDAR
jgi:hypothetical protein